jgi:ABC-type antimicrobial peptide transport system permease subunit
MIVGLASHLPAALQKGLTSHGLPAASASRIAHLPPVASLFAAFLGYNPVKQLLGTQLHQLPAAQAAALTGRSFFPRLISGPFSDALGIAFTFAVIACVVAAIASALRGGKYHYRDAGAASAQDPPTPGDVIAR